MKPVCECKYERKIVERNEEKAKWKARQQRLNALKKQSFMHIVDLSRPMVEENKLIISEVKRILKDEKDDIKYCISGVTKDISMSPPQKIIDGLKMSSPFQTPVSSEENILRTVIMPHRHWSPMNILPGPLPKKDACLKEEMERRKKARDEAFKLIYSNKNEQDSSSLMTRNDREAFNEELITKKKDDTKESHTNANEETPKTITELQSLSNKKAKKNSNKIGYQKDALHKKITDKVVREKKTYFEESSEIDHQQNISYKQVIDKTGEKIDYENRRMNGGSDKKYINNKSDLVAIMKVFSWIFLT